MRLCGWEGNRRSGIALVMCHRLSGPSTYGFNFNAGLVSLPSLLFLFCPSLPLEVGPLKIQLVGLGERCELSQRGLGRSPSRNQIECILAVKDAPVGYGTFTLPYIRRSAIRFLPVDVDNRFSAHQHTSTSSTSNSRQSTVLCLVYELPSLSTVSDHDIVHYNDKIMSATSQMTTKT